MSVRLMYHYYTSTRTYVIHACHMQSCSFPVTHLEVMMSDGVEGCMMGGEMISLVCCPWPSTVVLYTQRKPIIPCQFAQVNQTGNAVCTTRCSYQSHPRDVVINVNNLLLFTVLGIYFTE